MNPDFTKFQLTHLFSAKEFGHEAELRIPNLVNVNLVALWIQSDSRDGGVLDFKVRWSFQPLPGDDTLWFDNAADTVRRVPFSKGRQNQMVLIDIPPKALALRLDMKTSKALYSLEIDYSTGGSSRR